MSTLSAVNTINPLRPVGLPKKRPTHTPHDYAELVGRAPLDERSNSRLCLALMAFALGLVIGIYFTALLLQ